MARSRLGYSPALDGVRGLFMLCFMAYHFGVEQLAGMWVCINLFFVLSAFLIVRLMVEERERYGEIDVLAFYGRRARRLLPALFAVLAFVLVYGVVWADSAVRRGLRGDVLATLGYVMNWRLVGQGDQYFGTEGGASPLRHAWTLAIEEQFYVLVPLVVILLMRYVRRREVAVGILLACAVASAVWTAALGFHDASDYPRVYYGTDTRAQALFVGAALGFWLAPGRTYRIPRLPHPLVLAAGAVGLASSLFSFLVIGPYTGWMFNAGGMLAFAVGSALLVIGCVDPRPSWLRSAFGWGPIAYAGRLSYGLYLWHWPIHLVLLQLGVPVLVHLVAGSLLTVGIAHLSYQHLERPVIKHGVRGLLPSARSPLPFVLVPVLLLAGGGIAVAAGAPATEPTDAGSQVAVPTGPPPKVQAGQPAYVKGSPARIGVYGDSVPYFLVERFPAQTFPGVALDNYGREGCDLLSEPMSWAPGFQMGNEPLCTEMKKTWPTTFEEQGDDVLLIWASPLLAVPHVVDGERLWLDDPEYVDLIERRLDTVRQEAIDSGAEQVQIVNVPCRKPVESSIPEEFRVVFDANPEIVAEYKEPRRINALVKRWAASHDDVELVDLHGALCSDGYPEQIGGIQVFNDYLHFSPEATPMIWSYVLGQVSEGYAARERG